MRAEDTEGGREWEEKYGRRKEYDEKKKRRKEGREKKMNVETHW